MTTYFTYASSLQAGDLAPGTAANAGVSLPPYRSKEYELGYKASLRRRSTSRRRCSASSGRSPTSIRVDNVFKISGQQVNKGLELSAIGQVVEGLTVYGGVTFLDARLEHTPLATSNDKIYVGAPKVKGNLLFEYQMSTVCPVWWPSFDYQFSGERARQRHQLVHGAGLQPVRSRRCATARSSSARPTTWRLAVNNLTDRNYWSTIGPSNLTGANTGNLLAHLGTPRTLLASVSVEL